MFPKMFSETFLSVGPPPLPVVLVRQHSRTGLGPLSEHPKELIHHFHCMKKLNKASVYAEVVPHQILSMLVPEVYTFWTTDHIKWSFVILYPVYCILFQYLGWGKPKTKTKQSKYRELTCSLPACLLLTFQIILMVVQKVDISRWSSWVKMFLSSLIWYQMLFQILMCLFLFLGFNYYI